MNTAEKPNVSIIVPIYNGEKWIDSCFDSILNQSAIGKLTIEVSVCNDGSTDKTPEMLENWKEKFHQNNVTYKIWTNNISGGVGHSKNKAVTNSLGTYLCFQDVDDIMLPDRVLKQYNLASIEDDDTIVGCQFRREPPNSAIRYTRWANNLPDEKLDVQVFTSHGPSVIMPTWFCHRDVFDRVGGFSEQGKGTPEDLIFFYKHLDLGGKIKRVNECLLVYTYHEDAATFSVSEKTIWHLRLQRLENVVLPQWHQFTIWNAGKQGRKLYNSLSQENKEKVVALCDVDVKKVGKKYTPYDPNKRQAGASVAIVHYKKALPPFVICVKLDLTQGAFERNLSELNLHEGQDYVLFS